MKEQALRILGAPAEPGSSRNLAPEYLQARILLALQEAGAMIPLAFHGGTALRFLFDLPRFSEDLDFALERPERGELDLAQLADRVATQLRREGYDVTVVVKTGHVVQSAMIGFRGLLYEAGISHHREQALRIRIEVDTRPPAGAGLETTLVRRHALLNLQHHDRSSLLAGKLLAILQRRWTKGRDLFDLLWFLSDPRWPGPNLQLLNNGLAQGGWQGPALEESTWGGAMHERVASLSWEAAQRDAAPFLEPGPARDLFDRDALLGLLAARASRT